MYKARERDGKWEVINSESGEVLKVHEGDGAKLAAERQAQLMNEIEADPEWEN